MKLLLQYSDWFEMTKFDNKCSVQLVTIENQQSHFYVVNVRIVKVPAQSGHQGSTLPLNGPLTLRVPT